MKFLEVLLNNSPEVVDIKINNKIKNFDRWKLESISKVDSVEFVFNEKQSIMMIVSDLEYEIFESLVDTIGCKILKVVDHSQDVLFDNAICLDFFDQSGQSVSQKIKDLMINFKLQMCDCDVILDKILEKGMGSLTEFDKQFLK
jgi:hypothetical protein